MDALPRLSLSVERVLDAVHDTWKTEATHSTTPAVSAVTQAMLGLGAVPVIRDRLTRQLREVLAERDEQLQSAAALTLANLMRRHRVYMGRETRRRLSEIAQRSKDRNARRQAFAAGVLAALELGTVSRRRWIQAALREGDWRIQLSAYDALKRWHREALHEADEMLLEVQQELLSGPTMSQATVAADLLGRDPQDGQGAQVLARVDDHGRNWAVQEIATAAFRDTAKRLPEPPEWAVECLRHAPTADNDRTAERLAALRNTLPSLCRANPRWARPLLLEAADYVRSLDTWPSASVRRVLYGLATAAPAADADAVETLWEAVADHNDASVWSDTARRSDALRWLRLAARASKGDVDRLLLSYTSLDPERRPPSPDPEKIASTLGHSVGWRAAVRALPTMPPGARERVLQALRCLEQPPALLAPALLPEPESTAALCAALADPELRKDAALLLAPPRPNYSGQGLPADAWDGLEHALLDATPRILIGFGKNTTSRVVAAHIAAVAGRHNPERAGRLLANASAESTGLDAKRIHTTLIQFLRATGVGHSSPSVADAVAEAVTHLLRYKHKDTRRATGGELLRSLGTLLPIGTVAGLARTAFEDRVYSVRDGAIVAMATATARSSENVAPMLDLLRHRYHLQRLSAAQLLNATDHPRGLRHVAPNDVRPASQLATIA